MNKAHRSFIYLYMCTFIFIYVSYSLPNVWTELADFFKGLTYGYPRGNLGYLIFLFHGQRRALQLVMHITKRSNLHETIGTNLRHHSSYILQKISSIRNENMGSSKKI